MNTNKRSDQFQIDEIISIQEPAILTDSDLIKSFLNKKQKTSNLINEALNQHSLKPQSSPKLTNQCALNSESKQSSNHGDVLKNNFFHMLQPSHSKLAIRLFGNKKEIQKEIQRHEELNRWLIHPCSNFRFYWDLLMLILLIANIVFLPVCFSFLYEEMTHWAMLSFNLVSDTMFMLNILINFRTGDVKLK
jgi:hypothetical protein